MALVKPTILFAMPAYGPIEPRVVTNLVQAYHHTIVSGADVTLAMQSEPRVDYARNNLVKQALEHEEITHIMWVDSDVCIPKESVTRLFSHNVAVVGGLYQFKYGLHGPVVFDGAFKPLKNLISETEVHTVSGMGMGCCLVVADIYRQMTKVFGDHLWYDLSPDVGEDAHFFKRLKEMEIPVHLDPGVRCMHMRSTPIIFQDWRRL